MIATETVRTIVLVLFALCVLWVVKVVVKREFETLARAIVVTALIGGALLYVQGTKHPYLSLKIIKGDIFPSGTRSFTFTKQEFTTGGVPSVRYLFPATRPDGTTSGPSPQLKLTLDPNGKNYHITDVEPVNLVLGELGLPPVKTGAPELASVTGRLADVNYYRWDDYEMGILTLERGLCNDKDSLERYHCIVSLRIQNRY